MFGAGSNNNRDVFTPTFTNPFINGSNEMGVPFFDVTTLGSFFTSVNYIAAIKDSTDNWYSGWTCNSSTLNFGTGTNCTSLPTT